MAPRGGFWTSIDGLKYEPKMQYRFKVDIEGFSLEDARTKPPGDYAADSHVVGGTTMWYAKSVDKPGYSLAVMGEGEFPLGGDQQAINVQVTKPMFKPVTMSLIDPTYPNTTRELLRFLRRTGYHDLEIDSGVYGNLQAYRASVGNVIIHQLDQDGDSLEKWTLHGAVPVELDFGKLDYSSTEPVVITIKWIYDTFTCWMRGDHEENELDYPYFKDLPAGGNPNLIDTSDCAARWSSFSRDPSNITKKNGETMTQKEWQEGLAPADPCYLATPPPATDD